MHIVFLTYLIHKYELIFHTQLEWNIKKKIRVLNK